MEFEKKVIVDVDGFIETGKQFDLDLKLPEDNRNVVYGIVKDSCGKPVCDAVIKLVEVCKDERKPVTHTFTDKEGEFVFGPLCPNKSYAIEIWVNRVKHIKICKTCEKEGRCLKGVELYCDKEDRYEKKSNNYNKYENDRYEYDKYEKDYKNEKYNKELNDEKNCKDEEYDKDYNNEKEHKDKTHEQEYKEDEKYDKEYNEEKENKDEKYDNYDKCNRCDMKEPKKRYEY